MLESIPVYVWWIIGFIVAVAIWIWILDDSSKTGLISFAKKYSIPIMIVLAYFMMRTYSGNFEEEDFFYKQANTFTALLILVYIGLRNFLGTLRYKTTQAVVDNRSGSCDKYHEKDDYVILSIGTTNHDGIAWAWGNETWVVPTKHLSKINKVRNSPTQIVIETHISKCDLIEVPEECQDFIETASGYNKDNIYYGEFTLSELKSKDLKFKSDTGDGELNTKEYEQRLKDLNRLHNERGTMLDGKTSKIKQFISDAKAIDNTASGRGIIKRRQSSDDEREY